MSFLPDWFKPLTWNILYTSACNLILDPLASPAEFSKLSISVIKAKKKVKTAVEVENKMAVDCFSKELARPDPLEPSHRLNGWHFICFVPITTESPAHPSARSAWYCHKQVDSLFLSLSLRRGERKPETFYTITGGNAEVCVCCDKTERWETDMGRAAVVTHTCRQNHTHTHTHTHTRIGTATESRAKGHYSEVISAEKDYSTWISTINVWICIWSKIMTDRVDKGFIFITFSFHSVCVRLCVCVCVSFADALALLECPAVCRRPLLPIAFHFSPCREQTRKKLHMWTHRHMHMGT